MNNIEFEQTFFRHRSHCPYNHTTCQSYENSIIQHHKQGFIFSQDFLNKYISFLTSNRSWYSSYNCLDRGHYNKALSQLCQYLVPNEAQLIHLAMYKNSLPIFVTLVNNGYKLSPNILLQAITNNNRNRNNLYDIIALLCKNTDCTKKHLIEACKQNLYNIVELLLQYNIDIDIDCLINGSLSSNSKILDTLLKYNNNPNINCLENCCLINNIDNVKKLLNYRLMPNKKCFTNIFIHNTNKYGYKCYNKNSRQSIVNLLIEFGYNPNFDDAVIALEYNCIINDIHRFNIKLDEKLLEYCYKYNNHIYDIKATPTIKCLREECKKVGNIKSIKDIILKHGVKPDILCLENACKNRSNIQIVSFLIKHGIIPNINCIKETANCFSQNTTLMHLINNYKDSNEKKSLSTQYNINDINQDKFNIIIPTKYKKNNKFIGIENNNNNINKTALKLTNLSINKKIQINIKEEKELRDDVLVFFNFNKRTSSFINLRKIILQYIIDNTLYEKNIIKLNNKFKKLLKIKNKKKIYLHFKELDNIVHKLY